MTTSGTSTRSTRRALAPASSSSTCTRAPRWKTPTSSRRSTSWVSDDASTARQASRPASARCWPTRPASTRDPRRRAPEAAAQGQTLFSSSGDTGSLMPRDRRRERRPGWACRACKYPAASPYAIGVGGTTVLGSGPNEIGWYAGGGGTSVIESTPSGSERRGQLPRCDAGSARREPRRRPRTAATTCSSTAGRGDRRNQRQRSFVAGHLGASQGRARRHARLRRARDLRRQPETAFNDITLGSNGLFPDTPGWDYMTGLGTPKIEAFVAGA